MTSAAPSGSSRRRPSPTRPWAPDPGTARPGLAAEEHREKGLLGGTAAGVQVRYLVMRVTEALPHDRVKRLALLTPIGYGAGGSSSRCPVGERGFAPPVTGGARLTPWRTTTDLF